MNDVCDGFCVASCFYSGIITSFPENRVKYFPPNVRLQLPKVSSRVIERNFVDVKNIYFKLFQTLENMQALKAISVGMNYWRIFLSRELSFIS